MHLHEFLSELHLVIQPKVYLEVGVQHGTSLRLAHQADVAIGIDPAPLTLSQDNQNIYTMTSDDYFSGNPYGPDPGHHLKIDFGFIDGLHHFEQALQDFINIEKHTHSMSVVVFDDVLPRNQGEAAREQCPGDWTGDVWKVTHALLKHRPELRVFEVDTQPTGTLLVYGFQYEPVTSDEKLMKEATRELLALNNVPNPVLERTYAIQPAEALARLKEFLS